MINFILINVITPTKNIAMNWKQKKDEWNESMNHEGVYESHNPT